MIAEPETAARTGERDLAREEAALLVDEEPAATSRCTLGRIALHSSWVVLFLCGAMTSSAFTGHLGGNLPGVVSAGVASPAARPHLSHAADQQPSRLAAIPAHAAHAALAVAPQRAAHVSDDGAAKALAAEPVARGAAQGRSLMNPRSTYAFALLVTHDDVTQGDGLPDRVYGMLAIARSLQRLSRRAHNVVLLTDMTYLPDGLPVDSRLAPLGVEVRQLTKVDTGGKLASSIVNRLQVWNLTDFEKVVFMAHDTIAYRDVDWLFDKEGTWAARDDPTCSMSAHATNTDIMVLQPNNKDFIELMRHAADQPTNSIHRIIDSYFNEVRLQPVRLLSEVEADYGQCMGARIPTPYRNSDGTPVTGLWSTPAIVQRSGGIRYAGQEHDDANVCFCASMARQTIQGKWSKANVCHYHPLGAYWRDHFCYAAGKVLQMEQLPEARIFCHDRCYYTGKDC